MKSDPNAKQRVINSLEKIAALAESYSLTDPLDPYLQSHLEDIRSRFKQVCSVLGISPGQPSSLSSSGISFWSCDSWPQLSDHMIHITHTIILLTHMIDNDRGLWHRWFWQWWAWVPGGWGSVSAPKVHKIDRPTVIQLPKSLIVIDCPGSGLTVMRGL